MLESAGVYVPCIYSHARWELPYGTEQVFVVVYKHSILATTRTYLKVCDEVKNGTYMHQWSTSTDRR